MAYFLGSDVKVCLTTEDADYGLNVTSGSTGLYDLTADNSSPNAVWNRNATYLATGSGGQLVDVVGLDLGIGAMDEDVSYLGHRTPLKAEVHKETTVSLTLKRKNANWDVIFTGDSDSNIGRWGVKDSALFNGLEEVTTDYGFRLAIHMKGNSECFTVRNAALVGHTVTLNADGTQEESLDFSSQVEPVIDNAAYDTATTEAEL
tara:strand:- start:8600 stop:9211 length:612 start_codon:yes stop_codon:yes gene_type:complete